MNSFIAKITTHSQSGAFIKFNNNIVYPFAGTKKLFCSHKTTTWECDKYSKSVDVRRTNRGKSTESASTKHRKNYNSIRFLFLWEKVFFWEEKLSKLSTTTKMREWNELFLKNDKQNIATQLKTALEKLQLSSSTFFCVF